MDQRLALLEAFGIDAAVIFHFDEGLAEASPAAFVTDWLASGLGVGGVGTGNDFTFGHDRGGDIAILARPCADMGIEAGAVPGPEEQTSKFMSRMRTSYAVFRWKK